MFQLLKRIFHNSRRLLTFAKLIHFLIRRENISSCFPAGRIFPYVLPPGGYFLMFSRQGGRIFLLGNICLPGNIKKYLPQSREKSRNILYKEGGNVSCLFVHVQENILICTCANKEHFLLLVKLLNKSWHKITYVLLGWLDLGNNEFEEKFFVFLCLSQPLLTFWHFEVHFDPQLHQGPKKIF